MAKPQTKETAAKITALERSAGLDKAMREAFEKSKVEGAELSADSRKDMIEILYDLKKELDKGLGDINIENLKNKNKNQFWI